MDNIWTEEDRPNLLDRIIGQEAIVVLKSFVKNQNVIDCTLTGPPGVGKTTAVRALAKELYGTTPDEHGVSHFDKNFMQLNASDERGINVVRGKISDFAEGSPTHPEVKYKLIFLDEAERLCLPIGTKILVGTKSGKRFVKIEDISQENYTSMYSVNLETGEIEKDKGKCLYSGKAIFYKLTFDNGKEVIASEDHPFFTPDLKEITVIDMQIGDKVLDYEKDLELKRCKICDKITPIKDHCSRECASKTHSTRMSGSGNTMYGKEAWNHNKTKFDDERIEKQGHLGDENCSKRPEVVAKRRISLQKVWDELSEEERQEKIDNSLGIAWNNRRGKTYEEFFGDRSDEERAKRSIYGKIEFKDSNYRRHIVVNELNQVECNVCKKWFDLSGIYVHHLDGNRDNNIHSNLQCVCPKCHNMEMHGVTERFLEKGWEITHQPKNGVCSNGIDCPEEIAMISKEYIGEDIAYNITMLKNPSFFLANGILTHNTSEAQDALRSIIERYSNNCRFVLSCNNINMLSDAILSRQIPIPFHPLSSEDIKIIILEACHAHDLTIDEESIEFLTVSSRGDCRRVLQRIQIASMINPNIEMKTLLKFIPKSDDRITKEILTLSLSKNFEKARELLIQQYTDSHMDSNVILESIERVVSTSGDSFPNQMAYMKVIAKIGEVSYNIHRSSIPLYVLISLISDIIIILSIPINCVHVKK